MNILSIGLLLGLIMNLKLFGMEGILITGLFLCAFAPNQNYDLKEVRILFYKTPESKQAANDLYTKMEDVTEDLPILYGYKGMSELMICYHAFNPIVKLKYFYRGIHKLDKAIEDDKNNVELHYLRFSVQCNVPAFINYRSNIDEDKQIVINYLSDRQNKNRDEDLYLRMKDFMASNKKCTPEEKQRIKNL